MLDSLSSAWAVVSDHEAVVAARAAVGTAEVGIDDEFHPGDARLAQGALGRCFRNVHRTGLPWSGARRVPGRGSARIVGHLRATGWPEVSIALVVEHFSRIGSARPGWIAHRRQVSAIRRVRGSCSVHFG